MAPSLVRSVGRSVDGKCHKYLESDLNERAAPPMPIGDYLPPSATTAIIDARRRRRCAGARSFPVGDRDRSAVGSQILRRCFSPTMPRKDGIPNLLMGSETRGGTCAPWSDDRRRAGPLRLSQNRRFLVVVGILNSRHVNG